MKCDEIRPICTGCTTKGFSCEWPFPAQGVAARTDRPSAGKSIKEPQGGPFTNTGRPLGLGDENRNPWSAFSVTSSHYPVPLRPALPERQWECANSIVLTPQDRRFLEYFPSTNVFGWHNFGRWDTMQYIVRHLAPASSVITRMMISISASEMQRRGLHIGLSNRAQTFDLGLHHYNLALGHLRNSLVLNHERHGGTETLPVMLAAIFLMVRYENQNRLYPEGVKAHVNGLWALLNTHPLFSGEQGEHSRAILDVPSQQMNFTLSLSCRIIDLLLFVSPADLTLPPVPSVPSDLSSRCY